MVRERILIVEDDAETAAAIAAAVRSLGAEPQLAGTLAEGLMLAAAAAGRATGGAAAGPLAEGPAATEAAGGVAGQASGQAAAQVASEKARGGTDPSGHGSASGLATEPAHEPVPGPAPGPAGQAAGSTSTGAAARAQAMAGGAATGTTASSGLASPAAESPATANSGLANSGAGGDFAVIVLDRMLPGGDGIEAIARLRAAGSTALVLVVSALGRAANRIEGLDLGADDYLAKPYEPEELKARLRALLRRRAMAVQDNDLIAFGPLQIRLKARTVHVGAEHVPLSPREFQLLRYLARNAGQTVTRMQLLEHVWNLHFDPQTNVVDVHVGRLRRKLEAAAGHPVIQTERGAGYVFAPVAAPEAGA